MPGIVRYGVYVPFFRLARASFGGGKGERAAASYDEDSLSLAVEAGREALRGAPEVQGVLFATTSPPYAEKLNASTLHAALHLPHGVLAADLGGSTRAGLSGLLLSNIVANLRVGSNSQVRPRTFSAVTGCSLRCYRNPRGS